GRPQAISRRRRTDRLDLSGPAASDWLSRRALLEHGRDWAAAAVRSKPRKPLESPLRVGPGTACARRAANPSAKRSGASAKLVRRSLPDRNQRSPAAARSGPQRDESYRGCLSRGWPHTVRAARRPADLPRHLPPANQRRGGLLAGHSSAQRRSWATDRTVGYNSASPQAFVLRFSMSPRAWFRSS